MADIPRPGSPAWNTAWINAFKNTHGGLTPAEYNYLQALSRQAPTTPSAGVAMPAAPAPRIAPFLQPQEQIQFAQSNFDTATNLSQIDKALADLQTQTNYQRTQNDKNFNDTTSQAKDTFAARGLSQSSVKDAGLYDLQAQNTIRQGFLNDQLNNGLVAAQNQKNAIASRDTVLAQARLSLMAQNAGNAESMIPPAPAAAPAQPPGPAAAPAQPRSDVPGLHNAQYAQQYGAGSAYQNQWTQAFQNTHGGLTPSVYNYLQALYRAKNG